MTVRINRDLCNGCGEANEPPCMMVCPGDLIYKEAGRALLRDSRDCWDCAACVKECPRQAIEMVLPVQVGGRGSTLRAKTGSDRITWYLKRATGEEEIFEILTRVKRAGSNSYTR